MSDLRQATRVCAGHPARATGRYRGVTIISEHEAVCSFAIGARRTDAGDRLRVGISDTRRCAREYQRTHHEAESAPGLIADPRAS